MVGPQTAVLANESFIIVVSDAGTFSLSHDAGSCDDVTSGPNGEAWVTCTSRIMRVQLSSTPPRFLTTVSGVGWLQSSTDGGVWRRDGDTLSRYAGVGWVPSLPLCTPPELFTTWAVVTPTIAVGSCELPGPFGISPKLRVVEGASSSRTLATFDGGGPLFLSASDDFILVTNRFTSPPVTLQFFLDGGSQPFPQPGSTSAAPFIGSDGRPGSSIGSTTLRLDESLVWQPLTVTSGSVDFWSTSGFAFAPGGTVEFFGEMISAPIPTMDPAIASRTRANFLDGPKPRLVMGNRMYEAEPSGLRFLQTVMNGTFTGVRDGGFVAFGFGSGAYQFMRSLGGPATSITSPSSQYYSAQMVIQGTDTLALMVGANDGGHLLRLDADGGFTRRPVPFTNPSLLTTYRQMLILGRNSPMTLTDLTGTLGTLTNPPGGFLYALCGDTNLLYATTSGGLFVSDDDAMTWRLLDSSGTSSLACGAGIAAVLSGPTLIVSDGRRSRSWVCRARRVERARP